MPIESQTLILKVVEIEVSFSKQKHQYRLSQWGECVYGAQSSIERKLLCESMFIPFERRTSILNMVEIEVSFSKPKRRYHLSQSRECDCAANHEKKGDYYVNPWLSKLKDKFWF